ncbi:MAG: hypothetical protein HUU15_13840 [Candidatus Brocadiae bacterium]|nr:hypothetical protein [Candidatus Brocadiia bacterium]
MRHDVAAIAKKAGAGGIISGRKSTPAIRERLEAAFQDIRQGGVEILDFSHVDVLDFSGADEVVAKLAGRLAEGEYGTGTLVLTGCNEAVREGIHAALSTKGSCLMHFESRKKWSILGELEPYLKETLDLVMRSGTLLARDLATECKLKLNTASTRLINLLERRLVIRKEDPATKIGREYTYCSPLTAVLQDA